MSDFIDSEAQVVDSDNEVEGECVATVSDEEFIDDSEQSECLSNVTRNYIDVIEENRLQIENSTDLDARHYFDSDEEEPSWNEFSNYKAKVNLFKKSLILPHGINNPDSFFYAIVFAIRHHFTQKVDFVLDENLKQDVGFALFDKLFSIKNALQLDGQDVSHFRDQCFQVNTMLNKHNLFLRVFELKDKFRYLIKQNSESKNHFKELSACVIERFNGFLITRLEFDNEIRQNFNPIDVIYKPVIKVDAVIDCYFTDQLHLAFKAVYNETSDCKRIRTSSAFECYFCGRFWTRKVKRDTHLKQCMGQPGFVYNFQTRNLLTFEENVKFKRDVPLTTYIDFETTAPTDCCLDPESNKMDVVSYVIIAAFQPKLQLPRVIIERSFGHSLEKLSQIDYLTAEQLNYADTITLKQLRDCALACHEKSNRLAISEMFCTEIKFATSCLLKWFASKYKNFELNLDNKRKYEKENPIDWNNGHCAICTFPLSNNPTAVDNDKMTYGDFLIKKEHMFLRNIFSKEELEKSAPLCNLESFHQHFSEFLQIVVFLEHAINTSLQLANCQFVPLKRFIEAELGEFESFEQIKLVIENVEVKGYAQSKIPKFTLKLYAFVYERVMKFPFSQFECNTVTTANLFLGVHRIVNGKIHLHHSHVTGQVKGYVHDFCNLTVRENYDVVPCIAHNFFRFDMFFLLKGIRLSVWRTDELNIGGNHMVDINYAQIANFKFIDSVKYYQTSLAKLSETMSEEEKSRVGQLTQQFLVTHSYFSTVWKALSFNEKTKVIDIVVSGKGVIPYEKIKTINSLSITPENGVFFTRDEFYSSLKDEPVDEMSYLNAKTLFLTLKMRHLSDLNDLYNAQDVIILLEIIENRFQQIQDMTDYNPRIINSASKLSGCIQREKSKSIIALPTDNIQMDIFEKTVCGGYSAVNNRLSFDTELLMPNHAKADYVAHPELFKRDDLKLGYLLKLNNQRDYERKRVIAKIVKFDENNQYGYAMTRPMPTGCIKQNTSPAWSTFNLLMEKVSLEDQMGHLFVVDIEFDSANASPRQFLYNEIFPPIIEKKKIMEANERSLYQLLELFSKNERDKPRSYVCTAKSHATLLPKTCIPLYVEDLRFLVKRAGWKVTKLYSQFTFEQDTFKKDFVLMNQKSRQTAQNKIEKDFYKLMNNANFGFDCRNDANSLKFQPLIDEMNEVSFLKKYHDVFDPKISKFVSSKILEDHVEKEYLDELVKIKDDDPFKNIRVNQLKNERLKQLDGVERFKRQEKKRKNRVKKDDLDLRIESLLKDKRVKTMIDFASSNSIKSVAIKKKTNVNVTSRFIKGKMLMFAKLSIKSFVYDMIDVFCFPNEQIQRIYDNYQIEKCFLYQNLTDTDSTSLFFVFICKLESTLPESEARKVIFECLTKSKMLERLDVSDDYWKQYDVYDATTKKQMGLYEIENIDNPNVCTIAVNPKEYFEKFRNKDFNKKHKGVKKGTAGMMFENYANQIKHLRHDLDISPLAEFVTQRRFEIRNTEMKMKAIKKVKFARLNDKRYYFSDGIVSLPFGHTLLEKAREYKKQLGKIHLSIDKEKDAILKLENEAVMQNERLRILRCILAQPLVYFDLRTHELTEVKSAFKYATTKDYVLNSHWL